MGKLKMKRLVLFALLLGSPVSAQVVLQSWSCDTITAATNANPAVLTCNTPHGFANGATWFVGIYGATGNWKPVNTQWTARAIGAVQQGDTTMEVTDAFKQTIGDTVNMPHPCTALICLSGGNPENPATVTGIAGNILTLSRSNPTFHVASAFDFTPGSGGADINLNFNRNAYLIATAITPTTFSIADPSATNINSSGFGALTGTLRCERFKSDGSGVSSSYGTDYTGANNNPGLTHSVSGGLFTEVYPSVSNPASAHQVIASKAGAAGQQGVPVLAASNQVVVSGGVVTFTLPTGALSPWPYQGDPERQIIIGTLIYMDGWQDIRFEDAFVVSAITSNPPTAFSFPAPAGMTDGTYPGITSGGGARIVQRGVLNPDMQVSDVNGTWSFPGGYLQGFIESGTWSSSINRMYTWLRMSNRNVQKRSNGGYTGSFGTYVKIFPSITNETTQQYEEHWYHYHGSNWYDGQWVRVTLNAHPNHEVGGGTWEWPNEPTLNGYAGNSGYLGDNTHYFDEMGRVYTDFGNDMVTNLQGISYSLGPITLGTTSGEPDSSVSTVLALWSPTRFTQIAGCSALGGVDSGQPACTGALGTGPGWEMTWLAPLFDTVSYEIRRSTTSCKTVGFSSCLCNDGSTTCTSGNLDIVTRTPGSPYTIQQWFSPNTGGTYPGDMYFAIRPKFTVNYVSGNGISPIWLSTHTPMDMQTGDKITVAGVGGNTNANVTNVAITGQIPQQVWFLHNPIGIKVCAMSGNGVSPIAITTCTAHGLTTGDSVRVDAIQGSFLQPPGNPASVGYWTATVVDGTHLTLNGSTGNGTWTNSPSTFVHAPGMIVSVTASSGSCSMTTKSPHQLLVGMHLIFVNSNDPGQVLGPPPNNSETLRTVLTVPTSTTMTFSCAGVTDGTYNTDPPSDNPPSWWPTHDPNFPFTVRTDPAFSVAGTGNANWTSGGTAVSAENNTNFAEFFYGNVPGGASAPTITTLTLPNGTTGVAYSQTLTATGGATPYVWSISAGSLPTGLSLNSSTGAITGTPTVAAVFSFTAKCTGADTLFSTQPLSITINAPPPAIFTTFFGLTLINVTAH